MEDNKEEQKKKPGYETMSVSCRISLDDASYSRNMTERLIHLMEARETAGWEFRQECLRGNAQYKNAGFDMDRLMYLDNLIRTIDGAIYNLKFMGYGK